MPKPVSSWRMERTSPKDFGVPRPTWISLSALAVSTAQAFLPDDLVLGRRIRSKAILRVSRLPFRGIWGYGFVDERRLVSPRAMRHRRVAVRHTSLRAVRRP